MATLKEISNQCLAIAKIKPDIVDYNIQLIAAANLFISAYAKRIRDDINKGRPQEAYLITYDVEMQYDETRGVLRSKYKIYKPIRTNEYAPFKSVGSKDGRFILQYSNKQSFWMRRLSQFMSDVTCYTYEHDYLYIFNNHKIATVELTAAFELPYLIEIGNEEVQKLDNGEALLNEFPCPNDMINSIVAEVASMLISNPTSSGKA
jgi:hypothetical protein